MNKSCLVCIRILFKMLCCNQFDPSLCSHNPEPLASESIKEWGKKLRSSTESETACKQLMGIFTHNTPFCVYSLGLRRCCILLLNWIQAISVVSKMTEGVQLGSMLISHVAQVEPRLGQIFFTECLDIIRILRDLLLMSEGQIEVFPRFVTGTRSALSGGTSKAAESANTLARGVVITLSDEVSIVASTLCLCCQLETLLIRFSTNFFINNSNIGKLGSAIVSLLNCPQLVQAGQVLQRASANIPSHLIEGSIEIWLQIDSDYIDCGDKVDNISSVAQEGETQSVMREQLLKKLNIDHDQGNISIVQPSLEGVISVIDSGSWVEKFYIPHNLKLTDHDLTWLASDHLIGRKLTPFSTESFSPVSLYTLKDRQCLLPCMQWSISCKKLFGYIQYHLFRETIISVSARQRISHYNSLFPSIFGQKKSANLSIGCVVGYLCSVGDESALGELARLVGFPSVPELVVQYLHFPMLVHLLGSSSTGQFVTATVFGNKYPLSQLVEANGSELIVSLILLLCLHFDMNTIESVRAASLVVKDVITRVASSCAPPQRVIKKIRSDNTENVNPNVSGFLMDNYLHLIQLIEEEADCGHQLSVLIEAVGEETIKVFSVRTVETIRKATCRHANGCLWEIFSKMVDMDDRVSPLVLEHGHKSMTSEEIKILFGSSPVNQGSRVIEALCIELVKDRPVSCKGALLRAGLKVLKKTGVQNICEQSNELLSVLCDLVRLNMDNEEIVTLVGDLIGFAGPMLMSLNGPAVSIVVDSPSIRPSICLKEGQDNFLTSLIGRFLIPELKQSSHGFAVQEILKAVGGSGFLTKSSFSREQIVVLTPYLSSSYRSSGFDTKDALMGDIGSLEDIFVTLLAELKKEPMHSVFQALRPAVSKDTGLLSWSLPYLIEVVGTDSIDSEIELVRLITLLTSSFIRLIDSDNGGMSKKIDINTVFSTVDHLRSVRATKKHGNSRHFFSELITGVTDTTENIETYVKAALFVEDYARALWYQERLMKTRPGVCEQDILVLGAIYEKLNSPAGVLGACALDVEQSQYVEDLRLVTMGRYEYLIVRGENFGEKSICLLIELLVKSGHFRSALGLRRNETMNEKLHEAAWRLSDWSQLLSESMPIKRTHGFDETFAHILAKRSIGASDFSQTALSACRTGLVKKISLNISSEDVGRLFLLHLVERWDREYITEAIGNTKESLCRKTVLEGAIGIGKTGKWSELTICSLIELLKELRKSNNLSRAQQVLAMVKPILDLSNPEHVCEYAKTAWSVGNKADTVTFLSRTPFSSRGELLKLKYSAELELMIPKLMIASYRSLMKQTTSDKGDVCFAFGDYLDKVGSACLAIADTDTGKGVWNKNLLVREIACNFFDSIKFDCSGRRILYVLNRLFQLHWELFHSGDSNLMKLSGEIVQVIYTGWKQVPVWIWYMALPHLLVRLVGTSDFSSLCEDIIVAVMSVYPRQASWMVLPGLLNSRSPERRAAGGRIVQKVVEKSDYPNVQQLVAVVRVVAESLVSVARYDGPGGMMKTLSESKEGSRLLRNTGGLLVVPSKAQLATFSSSSLRQSQASPFGEEVRIAKFIDNVHVYNTKAKPKRIAIIDSNGHQVQFILKLEKKTDLRKDSRMMDFVNVINGEIGSKRVIETNMRTYQVLTLAEDTGLIEFVPNLVTIRKIIDESLVRIGKSVSQYLNKEVMSKLAHKTEGFPYYQSIVETIPPMLAEWFAKEFSNPRAWLRARNTFTQTQALWCIVGHVVGLGDRHPDNILIDTQSGAVVHVDFDCIFSRGMILNIPELVPFRLTPICVSGMGVTGVEGLFRSTSEHIMRLLRERRKMLLSVLHAFIADPLIDWQAGTNTSKKAKDVVQAIEKKLNGFVDVGEIRPDPNVNEEKLIVFNEASEKNSGLGKDRGASLSVEGQIDELIRAAVCPRNLAKMYLGWMPLF